jgi:hypothetical protein
MSRAEEVRGCWVEAEWDRTQASDGISRYGAYLRGHAERFEPFYGAGADGVTLDPVEFAVAALAVATGPIMSPGYLAWHPRVRDYQASRSEEDGRLLLSVTFAAPAPVRLPSPWWGWQQEFDRFVDPRDRHYAALTRLELRWPVATERLHQPQPPTSPGVPNLSDAKAAVGVVVAEISATTGPVLAELEPAAGQTRRMSW